MTEPTHGDEPATTTRLPDAPPVRRTFSHGDVLRVLSGLLLLALGVLFATVAENTISGIESDVIEAVGRLPDRVEEGIIAAAQLIATLFPLFIVLVVSWRRNWRLLGGLAITGALAAAAIVVVEAWLGTRDSADLLSERTFAGAWLTNPDFPSTAYLAAAASWVGIGSPWLHHRWRRAAWAWVILLMVLRIVGSGDPALDVVLAVALGIVVGSCVLLVVGSPNQEPQPSELLTSLRTVGLDPRAIDRIPGVGGATAYRLSDASGSVRDIRLRTPHDRSADLLDRVYRAIRLRSSEVTPPFSTLKRRIEHEALMFGAAQQAGARSARVAMAGTTAGGSAYLVLHPTPGSLASELEPDELTDTRLLDFWRQLAALHRAGIAHREPALDRVVIDTETDEVWLVDLDDADLAAPARDIARDVAVALVDVALATSPERAVATAMDTDGIDVVSSLPLLQPLALPSTVRSRLRADSSMLETLRREIEERTGASEPELADIERFSTRTVIMIVAGALAFYALLPQLAALDETIDAFGDARLTWVIGVLVASAASYFFATISFLGSLDTVLPFLASVRATVATAFTSLVGPSTAGRMALTVRFLQRAGMNSTDATASVALNSIAGLVTHLLLMFSFFAWTGSSSLGGFSLPDANTLLLILAAIALVVAIASLLGPIRRRFVIPAGQALRRAGGYVATVAQSPLRVLALLGGSSMITLSYVTALVFSVEAYGGGISVPQIGAAYLGAAAIANLAPTPGGLGALEAAMIAALTGFGLDDGVAVSSVLTFRLGTFWLPILPGWISFRWMTKHDEL